MAITTFDTIYIHSFESNGKTPPSLKERARMRKVCGPYQWHPSEPGKGRGFYQSCKGLCCGDATFDLRLREANDYLSGTRLGHITGYYCDSFQDETLKPIIALLPHERGFLAGWTMGAGMCASLDGYVWHTAEEAARAAHQTAEYDADESCLHEEQERDEERQLDDDDDDDE